MWGTWSVYWPQKYTRCPTKKVISVFDPLKSVFIGYWNQSANKLLILLGVVKHTSRSKITPWHSNQCALSITTNPSNKTGEIIYFFKIHTYVSYILRLRAFCKLYTWVLKAQRKKLIEIILTYVGLKVIIDCRARSVFEDLH